MTTTSVTFNVNGKYEKTSDGKGWKYNMDNITLTDPTFLPDSADPSKTSDINITPANFNNDISTALGKIEIDTRKKNRQQSNDSTIFTNISNTINNVVNKLTDQNKNNPEQPNKPSTTKFIDRLDNARNNETITNGKKSIEPSTAPAIDRIKDVQELINKKNKENKENKNGGIVLEWKIDDKNNVLYTKGNKPFRYLLYNNKINNKKTNVNLKSFTSANQNYDTNKDYLDTLYALVLDRINTNNPDIITQEDINKSTKTGGKTSKLRGGKRKTRRLTRKIRK